MIPLFSLLCISLIDIIHFSLESPSVVCIELSFSHMNQHKKLLELPLLCVLLSFSRMNQHKKLPEVSSSI